MKLKQGLAVVTSTEDTTNPQLSQVEEIFVLENEVILGVKILEVLQYDEHYHSWIVTLPQREYLKAVFVKTLPSRQALTLRPVRNTNYTNNVFVTLKYLL